MKTLGIIPSRYGSSRFPGKPLAILAGKPLVVWVVEAAKRAKSLDDVIVATDDLRIVEAVEAHGGKAVMTPSELPSGTDRIANAAGLFADDDILVNIQGDEPLIDPALIDRLVARMKEGERWDMATAVTPIRSAADLAAKSVVKVVLDRNDGALYFSRCPIPCDRDGEPDLACGLYVRHLGIYAYRGAFLRKYIAEPPCALERTEKLEQLRALWMGGRIAVIRTEDEGVGVDTPEDAERVAAILAKTVSFSQGGLTSRSPSLYPTPNQKKMANENDREAKLERLRAQLREIGSAAVAFSSGVDSTFLLRVAHEELGDRVIAVTARSHSFPKRELDEAAAFCRTEKIRHEIIDSEELDIPGFVANPPDRCYHCKKAIFGKIIAFAQANGLAAVLEGSNMDDDGDYRPGRRAIRELGRDGYPPTASRPRSGCASRGARPSQVYVASPLHDVGLTKVEIRALSKKMGLPTADKSSFACLASRFPYGERITAAGLERVELAEQWLMDAGLGLAQMRVRSHGNMARIEVPPADIPRIAARAEEIAAALKSFGFAYVALDLQGYRTGSMNETLPAAEKRMT